MTELDNKDVYKFESLGSIRKLVGGGGEAIEKE